MSESGSEQLVVFSRGGEEYALPIGAEQLEPVPTAGTDSVEAIARVGDRLV